MQCGWPRPWVGLVLESSRITNESNDVRRLEMYAVSDTLKVPIRDHTSRETMNGEKCQWPNIAPDLESIAH